MKIRGTGNLVDFNKPTPIEKAPPKSLRITIGQGSLV